MKRSIGLILFNVILIISLMGLPGQGRASETQDQIDAPAGTALQFNGSSQYVTFGVGNSLASLNFTIETWFKRTGPGIGVTTGTGGITSAIPLVTKGTSESEAALVDINYFLGIDANTGVLIADFEEGAAGTSPSLNHPLSGTTVINNNVWYHAAFTYNGTTMRLYLNGVEQSNLVVGQPAASATTSPTAFATSIRSNGTTIQGYFQGVLDEVRIWSSVRSPSEIQTNMFTELTSGTGLLGRWGMNEGSGTVINSSVGSFTGTLTNGPTWVVGFPLPDAIAPAAPTGLSGLPLNQGASLTWTGNTENDLAGYNIYRGTANGGPYTKVNVNLQTSPSYIDSGLTNGTPYYYVVRAVDYFANESGNSNQATVTPQSGSSSALQFDGTNDYVTFGQAPGLGLQNFTVETWFKRTGTGVAVSTGTNGVTAVPMVTKGSPQADGSNVDENYILGIRSSDNVLAGDFETYALCNARPAGDNTPIVGVTPIVNNTWYHAAFTYDGTALKLYLNGKLEATVASTCIPRYDSIQHAGLGTYLTSTGTSSGYFQGVLDEVRIWNVARTQTEILSSINQQIISGTGLVARWGLNEGTGTSIASSVGSFPGTLTNGPTWVPGAPFNLNIAPNIPTLVSPADGSTGISIPPNLTVHVTDALASPLTVSFYGRLKNGSVGADFTLIAIPDPQYYAASYPSIYNAQMTWVVANKTTSNIPYVMSMGDNVDDITNSTQWTRATTAWDILTTGSVPYGLELGNHDGAPSSTANFNTNFGTRIAGQSTYGGRYGTSDYDNTYATFSASGMDFIVLYIEYDTSMTSTSNPVLVWANGILAANPTKRAIVVTHDLLDNSSNFTPQGNAIYEALKGNANLFLMLSGHLDGSRQKTSIYNGHTVYSLRSDYQFVDGQQSGYLRIMRFSPVDDQIYITTYSPNQSKYLTDTTNQFNLSYAMDGAAAFTFIGSTTVPSGSDATVSWPGLAGNTAYEWYAIADNGGASTSSPTWSFTTASSGNNPPVITERASTSVSMSEDGSPTPFVLTLHATDPDVSDTLTWSISTPALHGTAKASGTGTSKVIGYTPTANYNGSDSFVVQVSDGHGGTDTITVNVTITPVNDAPVCSPVTLFTSKNITGQTDPSCTDVDGDILTYSIVAQPAHGSASVVAGKLSYTPSTDYTGPDSFTYKANDGTADSNAAAVSVTVTSLANNPPVITEGTSASVTMSEDGSPTPFVLTLHATDPDVSDTLTWSISTPASHGTAAASGTGTSKVIGYTPTANYNGSDSFVVQVSDGNGGTDTIAVNVTITAVNDAPVITEGDSTNVTMSEDGSPTPFNLTLHATDVDGSDTLTWSVIFQAGHGTASASGTGASKVISYIPNSHYTGSDSFIVQVSDGNGGTDMIIVNVTITPVIHPTFTIFLPVILR